MRSGAHDLARVPLNVELLGVPRWVPTLIELVHLALRLGAGAVVHTHAAARPLVFGMTTTPRFVIRATRARPVVSGRRRPSRGSGLVAVGAAAPASPGPVSSSVSSCSGLPEQPEPDLLPLRRTGLFAQAPIELRTC